MQLLYALRVVYSGHKLFSLTYCKHSISIIQWVFNMALTREQVYNDLTGDEAKEILVQRFQQRLNEVPWLRRLVTLPRVRMKVSVTLELYADQPTPETHILDDELTLVSESATHPTSAPHNPEPHVVDIEEVVDASPITGDPPDKIRDDHGLPIATPRRHPITKQTEDVMERSLGLRGPVELAPGVNLERVRDPNARDGMGTKVVQDFGPSRGRSDQSSVVSPNRRRADSPAPIQNDFKHSRG